MLGIMDGELNYVGNWLVFSIKYYIYDMKVNHKDLHVSATETQI